tara:strand:+ start:225 stop:377 length:153 start_codon:yes stop_codon:yes gene_type:complete
METTTKHPLSDIATINNRPDRVGVNQAPYHIMGNKRKRYLYLKNRRVKNV